MARLGLPPRITHWFRSGLIRRGFLILGLSACLALAACSASSGSSSKSSSGTPTKGGVVTFAESADYAPTWILPFYPGAFFTIQEQSWFENLMWPPLFNRQRREPDRQLRPESRQPAGLFR